MWKEQVDAAAVQVDGLAEMFFGHGAALDVPARAARGGAGRTGPLNRAIIGFPRLPEGEIADVLLLVGIGGLGLAEEHGAELELPLLHPRESAVAWK